VKRFRIEARLESPLVIRRERQSQRSEGAQFISGTLVRGAFAQLYLQRHGQADALFNRLFLDEEACRFGPLDPAARVFPLTAVSCKRQSGFGKDRHGVFDRLAASVGARLAGRLPPHRRCGVARCGEELKAHTGFWDWKNGTPSEPRRTWRRSMAAHVGIDRHTHTAAESVFFTLPALEPEPCRDSDQATPGLHGWLAAETDAIEALQKLLADEDHILRIGHARTRGYGRVGIDIRDCLPEPEQDCLGWSKTLLASTTRPLLDPDRYFLFSLSLPTGAVLVDELLRYTLDPAGMVPWLPPLPPPDPAVRTLDTPPKPFEGGRLWCVTAVAHHDRLRGWNVAHGLPRQDEWLVSRGSVFVYLHEGDEASRAALLQRLRDLQARGLGARRNEGFGQVVVGDDFHTRFTLKEMP
jgi:CRISPR-associated protein Csx10